MKCPGVYEPCSQNTLPENTICVHRENKEEHCPITNISVLYDPHEAVINQTANTNTSRVDGPRDGKALHKMNDTLANSSSIEAN